MTELCNCNEAVEAHEHCNDCDCVLTGNEGAICCSCEEIEIAMGNIPVIKASHHKTINLGEYTDIIRFAQACHKEGQTVIAETIIEAWQGLSKEAGQWLLQQDEVPHYNGNKNEVSFIYPPVEGL